METEPGYTIPGDQAGRLAEHDGAPAREDAADRALFADLASGDLIRIQRAIDAISRSHREPLARWLVRRGAQPDTAEDLAQDILIRLYMLAREGRIEDRGVPIGPLLRGIARNILREEARRAQIRRSRHQSLDLGPDGSPIDLADPGALTEFAVVDGEDDDRAYERAFAAALAALSPSDQALLDMRLRRGLFVPEIAALLEVTTGAAHTRLSRAVSRLVKLLPRTRVLVRAVESREPRRRARAMRGQLATA